MVPSLQMGCLAQESLLLPVNTNQYLQNTGSCQKHNHYGNQLFRFECQHDTTVLKHVCGSFSVSGLHPDRMSIDSIYIPFY